ncbi:hypothetical protein M422DRAFT_269203 [Sphaerobolus stellatus SS14]|uniref:Uncharacterized protein n=1 Tax=Sphaerobolus stellatus (strain SS14) TaxID=990650 RepID=A0A0C9UKI1_SPHS4|nr:hypothetical protein M422DRAFT_269203 [Sphaerobolus stellatus SS14]
MQLLQKAAITFFIESPHPVYMYGLLLFDEFTAAKIQELYYVPLIPQGSGFTAEARKHIEPAVYLSNAHEYVVPPFPFNPLLVVHYYSLASQQGKAKVDMVLSKWFLCDPGGVLEKNEGLGVTFAEKVGPEVTTFCRVRDGILCGVRHWRVEGLVGYQEATIEHDNTDVHERPSALSRAASQSLSRTQHNTLADDKLARRRIQALTQATAARMVISAQQHGTSATTNGKLEVEVALPLGNIDMLRILLVP